MNAAVVAALHPLVQRYLDQLAAALAATALPPAEQEAIVADIASHVAEAISAGERLPAVLERLGNAPDLARAYVVEAFLHPRGAIAPSRLALLGRRALRAATLAAAGLLGAILGAAGGLLLLLGPLGALAGIVMPFLPLEPNLRAGAPQVVVVLLSLLLGALGAGLLRLASWNLRLLRRPPAPKELSR